MGNSAPQKYKSYDEKYMRSAALSKIPKFYCDESRNYGQERMELLHVITLKKFALERLKCHEPLIPVYTDGYSSEEDTLTIDYSIVETSTTRKIRRDSITSMLKEQRRVNKRFRGWERRKRLLQEKIKDLENKLTEIEVEDYAAEFVFNADDNWWYNLKIKHHQGIECSRGSKIIKFDFSFSDLTGPIPSRLPKSLKTLDLSWNSFNFTIPVTLPDSLITCNLSNNNLTGNISKLPCQLETLNVSYNKLKGLLPKKLPTTLLCLDTSFNNFSGPIPTTLPSSIQELYL
eukprot:UN30750